MPPLRRLLIPTCVTLGNAACGFGALLLLSGQTEPWLSLAPPTRLAIAAWLVLAGWAFDMLDGTVAKLVGATSGFGGQLDSLCDAVTFGVLPSLLIAVTGGGHPLTVAAAGLYLFAVLVRLARFNEEASHAPDDHLYFKGLSSPAGAMTIAGFALCAGPIAGELPTAVQPLVPALLAALALALAGLMVSSVRYADLPKHYARKLIPWWRLLPAIIAVMLLPPPFVLLLLSLLYVAGGAIRALGTRLAAPRKASC